jgi:putative Holliday junction resolvase
MARSARAFAERLAAATGIPIELYDERLSSFEARERLREATSSRRTRRGVVDVMAAVVILEGWLQRRAGRLGP